MKRSMALAIRCALIAALAACARIDPPFPDVPPIMLDADVPTVFSMLRDAPPPPHYNPLGQSEITPEVALVPDHVFNQQLGWRVELDGLPYFVLKVVLQAKGHNATQVDVQVSLPPSPLTTASKLEPRDLATLAGAIDAELTEYAAAVVDRREPDTLYRVWQEYLYRVPMTEDERGAYRHRMQLARVAIMQPLEARLRQRLGDEWAIIFRSKDPAAPERDTPGRSGAHDAVDTGLPPTVRMRESSEPTASAAPAVNIGP